jgi:hypothetical protein
MPRHILIGLEMPTDLERFRLPEGLHVRLQDLLDRQESGEPLSPAERKGAEGLVELAELLSLLRLRAQRVSGEPPPLP